MTLAHSARQLASEIARLRPDWRNPERYFENREELVRCARRLARQLEDRTHG